MEPETKTKLGRPPVWEDPKELEAQIESFLEHCKQKKKHVTLTNFAVFTGVDRRTIFNYEKDETKKAFFPAIKKIKAACEAYTEDLLYSGKATGPIFSLINNYGWENLQKINHSGQIGMGAILDKLENGPKAS